MSEPDPEQEQKRREEMQAHQAASRHASQAASKTSFEHLQRAEFIDKLSDSEVSSEFFEEIEDILGPELSRIHMLANEGEEEHHRHFWLNENRAEQIIAEHNPGRLCKGPVAAIAQGVHNTDENVKTGFTEQQKRMVWEALSVKSGMQSLAKGNRGLRSLTEATAVTKHEHGDEGDSSSGKRFYKRVFG
ncbi:hypothetical protein EL22_25290 [Halostagnicola sp. A56]|uniref:hypothetical protein n=1 Tax=Halostagnicola sp. A56 TaxID=1495067 RepID=UPI00049ED7E7|nr:hypothetical protein [Halostagnicola sp. A56]KDE56687.1 hypothetical protein EL22_25290 [Halostagnicola sp. A56]